MATGSLNKSDRSCGVSEKSIEGCTDTPEQVVSLILKYMLWGAGRFRGRTLGSFRSNGYGGSTRPNSGPTILCSGLERIATALEKK